VSRASTLDELYQKHGAQGLQVLGIGVDDEEKLRVKAEEIELSYPVGASAETGHAYGVTDLPHTFFISREGRILASLPGGHPEECLEPGVEMALASKGSEEYNAARDRFDAARASFDAREAARRGYESLRQAQAIRDGGGDLGEEWHRLIGEAIEGYERAVALDPDLWQALSDWGVALLLQAETTSGPEAERLRRLALEKAVAAHRLMPGSYGAYNAACAHALLGEPQECRKWLETAREFDALPSVAHMQSDPDLDSVRDEEWFQEYLHR
jgi:tetratricopeptide (TPR) repeat protein